MIFLELAGQAVRGFSPTCRLALKPGYNALVSPTPVPSPLGGLAVALCYPDGRGGDAAFLAPGAKAGKAGLSIQGEDQNLWRLVRELGGTGGLHKLNRGTGQYEVVSQDAAEIAQTVRAQLGFPPRTTFDSLFVFSQLQQPSKRPKPAPSPPSAPQKPALSHRSLQPVSLSTSQRLDGPARELKLEELRKEHAISKKVADLQFRQDGLQSESFSLEGKVKSVDEARARVKQVSEQLAGKPTVESLKLPKDAIEKVGRYRVELKRLEDALARAIQDKEAAGATDPQNTGRPPPVWVDPRFTGTLLAGLAVLVGATFLEGSGRYLALLGVPAFTFSSLLALRYIEGLQNAARDSSRGDLYVNREKKIQDEISGQKAMVKAILSQARVEEPEEFLALFEGRPELEEQLVQERTKLAALENDPEISDAVHRVDQIRVELEQITKELLEESGGYVRDVREVERDIAKLEAENGPSVPAPATATSGAGFTAVATDAPEAFDDPAPALLMLGADLLHADIPKVSAMIKERAAQYVAAFTERRYHGFEFDKDGKARVLAPGRTVPMGQLPGEDLDLVWLGLRLALVEKYSGAQASKVPVVFEDHFSQLLGPQQKPLLIRMLKHLGTLTQVLHVSPAGQNAGSTEGLLAL